MSHHTEQRTWYPCESVTKNRLVTHCQAEIKQEDNRIQMILWPRLERTLCNLPVPLARKRDNPVLFLFAFCIPCRSISSLRWHVTVRYAICIAWNIIKVRLRFRSWLWTRISYQKHLACVPQRQQIILPVVCNGTITTKTKIIKISLQKKMGALGNGLCWFQKPHTTTPHATKIIVLIRAPR